MRSQGFKSRSHFSVLILEQHCRRVANFSSLLAGIYRIKAVNWMVLKGSYDYLMNYQKGYWFIDKYSYSCSQSFSRTGFNLLCFMQELKWGPWVCGRWPGLCWHAITRTLISFPYLKYTLDHPTDVDGLQIQTFNLYSFQNKRKMHCLTVQCFYLLQFLTFRYGHSG